MRVLVAHAVVSSESAAENATSTYDKRMRHTDDIYLKKGPLTISYRRNSDLLCSGSYLPPCCITSRKEESCLLKAPSGSFFRLEMSDWEDVSLTDAMVRSRMGLVEMCGKCCGKPAGADDECSGSQSDEGFISYLRALWLDARAVTSLNNPALKPMLMILCLGFTNLLTADNSMSAQNRRCLPRSLLSSRQSPDGLRDFSWALL